MLYTTDMLQLLVSLLMPSGNSKSIGDTLGDYHSN